MQNKNYKHIIPVFFLVKVTFSMMEIFQSLYYTFKKISGTEKIVSWKCKGLSFETIVTPITTDNSFIFYELHRWSQDLNADFTLKDFVWRC